MIRSISISFIFTLLGKIVAFLRIQQMANNYPNSHWLDAFFISFSFTSFFETVVISGAVATVFIPKYISIKSEDKKNLFFRDIYFSLLFIFTLISLFIFVFSGEIASILVSKNNPVLEHSTQSLLEIFCLLPIVSLLFQLPTQGNQINNRFNISTLNPIILNTFQLVLIFIFVEMTVSDEFAVYSFTVVYLLSMLFCYLCQRHYFSNRYGLVEKFNRKHIFSTLLALLPLGAFLSIEEINLLVDQYFASGFAEGAVANLMYANRLVKIFGAIFVAAILTVFYPKVSTLVSESNFKLANLITNRLMVLIILFSLPISIIFCIKGTEIASIVYGASLSESVGKVLSGYSFMVVFSSIYIFLLRVLFSLGKSTPIIIFGVFFLLLNYLLNTLLIEYLGLQGIAIASTIISLLQCVLLIYLLNSEGFKLVDTYNAKIILKHFLISFFSLSFAYLSSNNVIVFSTVFFLFYYILSILLSKRFYSELVGLR